MHSSGQVISVCCWYLFIRCMLGYGEAGLSWWWFWVKILYLFGYIILPLWFVHSSVLSCLIYDFPVYYIIRVDIPIIIFQLLSTFAYFSQFYQYVIYLIHLSHCSFNLFFGFNFLYIYIYIYILYIYIYIYIYIWGCKIDR